MDYLKLAHELYLQGKLDEAIESIKKAINLNDQDHHAYALLGLLYFKNKIGPLAEEAFIKTLSFKSEDFNAM